MMVNDSRFFLAAVGTVALALGGCVGDGGGAPAGDVLARESLRMTPGCYAVRYQFVEDSEHDFFFADGTEYVDLIPQGEGFRVRNFLILDQDNAFLHWIQEWTPLGNGRWRLRVLDGRENERYASEGGWDFNQWQGEAALAVKPTRDTERADYDMLERRNVFQFTADRWVQSEVNRKLRADGSPVANEVGWIVYERQDSDQPCAPAIALTAENA